MGLTSEEDRRLRVRAGAAVLFSVAAFCVGQATQANNESLSSSGLAWLTAGLLSCLVGILGSANCALSQQGERLTVAVLTCGLLFQLHQLFRFGSFRYVRLEDGSDYRSYLGAVFFAALAVGTLVAGPRRTRHLCFATLLVIHFFVGVWVIRHSPDPPIDVLMFHREAISAFVGGKNPYSITFPNIYASARTPKSGLEYYGPGHFRAGRSTFGYIYPSLSLLLSTPGAVLGGDSRYSLVVAVSAAALLMACAVPGRVAQLAALLYVYTPRTGFIVEMGWTEPFVVLLLSLVVFCICRWPKMVPAAFGLLLAVKQYLVFATPAIVLLMPRPFRFRKAASFSMQAAASALAVTLPLALWDVAAYVRSTVRFLLNLSFRSDSLSYTAWLVRHRVISATPWIGFLLLLPTSLFIVWRAPRSACGFASSVALTFLVFFAWNQAAFANYYYFVIGALCCAVATVPREAPRTESQSGVA